MSARLISVARLIADSSPWSGSYDDDWCHYCFAEPSYGPKPWTGHDEDCAWVQLLDALWEIDKAEATPDA